MQSGQYMDVIENILMLYIHNMQFLRNEYTFMQGEAPCYIQI